MEFGTSIALFLTIAVVLLVLFCLITKYFQYRVNKKAQQLGEEFSQVDEMTQQSDQDIEGNYEQFLEKRKLKNHEKEKSSSKKNREQAYLFETTEVEEPIKNSDDPIYGVSMLRKRLQGQTLSQPQDQTGRSMPSIKSFRPQRLQTGRSSMSSERGFGPSSNSKSTQQPLTRHEFISRLITYNQQGIFITDVGVQSLTKLHGKIKQKKLMNTTIINPRELGFEDQLEVLGFESKQYSCMKYKSIAEIPYMIENQEYPVAVLKISQAKEEIDFSEYYMLKDKIQSSIG